LVEQPDMTGRIFIPKTDEPHDVVGLGPQLPAA
jgi:hypothetical protein